MGQGKDGRGEGSGVFVLLCTLVLIVGIVAAVGMVISILNYTRESGTPININVDGPEDSNGQSESGGSMYTGGGSADTHYDSRIWTIQMDPDTHQRRIYIDAKSRQLRGYIVDVVNAVCQIAGKNCQIVESSHNNCWTNGAAAPGILDRWFDACAGFTITLDRVRSLKFSHAFARNNAPVFVTPSGNPGNFDPNNLDGKNIGFLSGWWADSNCIFYSTGYQLTKTQTFTYGDLPAAVDALNNGEVDAILISEQFKTLDDLFLVIAKKLSPCLLGGDAMMMRKDSLFKEWWNPAFEKMIVSRIYRGICSDVDDPNVHGNLPGESAAVLCDITAA